MGSNFESVIDRNRWDDLADRMEADPNAFQAGCWASVEKRIAFYRSCAISAKLEDNA